VEVLVPFTGLVLTFPVWLKASLALAVAVVGFTSDNLAVALQEWKNGNHRAAFLFVPSWTSYALIIVMASSTASIIGVSELVSRCNTVINATGNTQLMLPIYLYACLFFFAFCWPLTLLMKRISATLARRLAPAGAVGRAGAADPGGSERMPITEG
jgi:polar amino acid transport system permease protein